MIRRHEQLVNQMFHGERALGVFDLLASTTKAVKMRTETDGIYLRGAGKQWWLVPWADVWRYALGHGNVVAPHNLPWVLRAAERRARALLRKAQEIQKAEGATHTQGPLPAAPGGNTGGAL